MSLIEIREACLRDACFVAAFMREQDVAEIGAVVDVENRAGIAAWCLGNSQFAHENPDMRWAHIAYVRGQPVAVFGFARIAPHIASGWAFGTKLLPRAIPRISAWAMVHYPPRLIGAGIRRVEVRTKADHDLSHGWLRSVGAVCETPEPFEYGRRGELFVQYAWTSRTWRGQAGGAARTKWGRANGRRPGQALKDTRARG